MRKPTVITKCVANTYTGPNERIVEVSDREMGRGCLISVRRVLTEDGGKLVVNVYAADPGVVLHINGQELQLSA